MTKVLRCPICNMAMIWFKDTLLCRKCDEEQIGDLAYDYNKNRGNKNEK